MELSHGTLAFAEQEFQMYTIVFRHIALGLLLSQDFKLSNVEAKENLFDLK